MTLINSAYLFVLILGLTSLKAQVVKNEDIAFPSGITLRPIAEDSRFPDVELTGSRLFKVGLGGVSDVRRLTLNVPVSGWKDKSQQEFRVHPAFVDCVQRVWTELQNGNHKLRLVEGFLGSGGESVRDRYRRSGTGAAIGFDPSDTNKDFKLMAKSFLRHCPPIFAPLGRDLGMVIEANAIFTYMTGSKSPSVQTVTVSGNSQFGGVDINAWVRDRTNEVTDSAQLPTCKAGISALTSGGIHPSTATSDPALTVGPVDKTVTRATADPDRQDFLRLVQFPSDNVEFTVPSATPNCPAAGGIHGNSPTTRCGPRLMAPRMYAKMKLLQRFVRTSLSTKLRVVEGWTDESVDAVSKLRNEARQVKVQLVASNTAVRLGEVSKFAICVGFDFIKHGGDHLILAVEKQLKSSSKPVVFSNGRLLPVAAPQSDWETLYKTSEGFDGDDYPLFDSKVRGSVELYDDAKASLFKSKESDVRYFRVSPQLVQCYSELVLYENRDKSSPDPKTNIKVVRAYMSNMEETSAFNPVYDRRLNKHTLGLALHLAYADPKPGFDHWRLARTVASVCPFIFHNQKDTSNGRGAGMGIYTDGVFIGMQESTLVWLECEECDRLKPPESAENVKQKLLTRMKESQEDRVINPNDWTTACTFDVAPKPQDPNFKHEHPVATMRVRRSTEPSPECQIGAAESSFCRKSKAQRQSEVERIRNIIHMKHLLADKTRVNNALDGCLLSCSKCTTGPQWDQKVEHCNNLVHWIPFELLNDQHGLITNIYPLIDKIARYNACERGGHCLDLSPLYSIFAPGLNSKFRPEAGKANKELVYDPVENPSPMISLMTSLYALMARGKVQLWLRTESDIAGMEYALKVLFAYNRHVESVHINVLDKSAESTIISSLESRLDAWRTTVCPKNSREALTPYTVAEAPVETAFSSSMFDLRHRLRDEDEMLETHGLRPDFI